MEVHCELARIIISEGTDGQVIFLREKSGTRAFPIVIGIYEAYAIQRKVGSEKTPRPLTHDLLASVITEMGGTLSRIVVTELKNDTFYARLHIMMDGRSLSIDARPSDAIALAVQLNADIYVDEEVLNQVAHYQMPVSEEEEEGEEEDSDEASDFPDDETDAD